jgi:homeobox protein cut-like
LLIYSKAYQTYIDLVTNQSKAIHSAFLQVYTPLSEAPDPYPLLEASIDSLVTAEETLPKVIEENQALHKTVNRLTSQLEETEKRVEQERASRQGLEESRDEKIKSVEASWTAVLSEKQDNWEAKEKSLEEKIENQDRLLKELKASYEVSQRLNRGEDADAESHRGATVAELEIVSSELDRANMRLAEVEARNEQLRLELAQSSSKSDTKPKTAIEDDPTFLRLQSENSSMLRRLENARFEKDAEKRKWVGSIRTLEREVSNLKNDNDSLREKIHQWGDYENVKRELEVLKSIEFATGEDDEFDRDDTATPEPSSDTLENGSSKKAETLEQLLLARNKKLSNELTLLRVSHQDLQSRLETLQEELSNTNMELEKSRNLTARLEDDLEKVQQEASNAFPSSAMSVAGTYTSRYPHSSLRRGRATSPTSSIISGFDPAHMGSPSPRDEPMGGGSGILPMVTAQRDRFKRKNAELESELQKQYQTVSSLRSEIASLQKDNLNLYEKTRYVSAYSRGGSASRNDTTIQISGNDAASSGMSLGLESRYRPAYESSLSPFAAFRGRETARVFRGLSWPERVVFRIAKMVLATRTSRNLFAAYCFALHILVLMMLYWMSSAAGVPVHVAGPVAAREAAKAAGVAAGPGGGVKAEWQKEGFQAGG